MPGIFFPRITGLYDSLQEIWEKPRTERGLGMLLLWFYLLTLLAVELARARLFPAWLPKPPLLHYYAIELAFTLILAIEVLSLIFVLPTSLSSSMGKQFEILTLILLRNAFKELSFLPEPVYIGMENVTQLLDIAASGAAALIVFLCLGMYRRFGRRWHINLSPEAVGRYVASKKLVAICLLLVFVYLGILDFWKFLQGEDAHFFETIYTVLIFADITMVLIAQCYMPCYYAVFRNSGFVVGTLLMRLSLSAPPLLCGAIAVFAALFVLCLNYGVNCFAPSGEEC